MTNKYIMAYSRIDDWMFDNRINDNYKEVDHEMDIIKEACIKSDKYRWHDLRKNPKDLPDGNLDTPLDVTFSTKINPNGRYYTSATYVRGEFIYSNRNILDKVIAWKYAETFEEVEI